jgi:hypothetical protein
MADTADSRRIEQLIEQQKITNEHLAALGQAFSVASVAFTSLTEEVRNLKAVPVFVEQVALQEPVDMSVGPTGNKKGRR